MKHWLIGAALALSPIGAAAQSLDVVASFSILGDMARQIGGDRIALKTLVGPDSDAHVYEPRPADAMALARADVVLMNGLEFEGFMARLITASRTEAAVITVTDGADIMADPNGGHYHYVDGKAIFHAGAHDPHAWQSIANARVFAANITDAFCAADAEGCDSYRANAARYDTELTALDAEIHAMFDPIPQDRRTVVVTHNAFGYFARDYGLTFLSPQGVSTESEATAADVGSLIREIREHKTSAIFGENISDTRLIHRIADEAGLEVASVLYSDALTAEDGPAPTYATMMRQNAQAIAAALTPQQEG